MGNKYRGQDAPMVLLTTSIPVPLPPPPHSPSRCISLAIVPIVTALGIWVYLVLVRPTTRTDPSPSSALSYSDDSNFGSAPPPTCTWCTSSAKTAPKWLGGLPTTSMTAPPSPCYPLQPSHNHNPNHNHSLPENWNMVLPGRSPAVPSYPVENNNNRSFPSSPGSATDLSPSTYSEAKGYFDFVPIQSAQYDHSGPISPGSLSVSDNDLVNEMGSLNPSRESFHSFLGSVIAYSDVHSPFEWLLPDAKSAGF
jgi:hypothetical protein